MQVFFYFFFFYITSREVAPELKPQKLKKCFKTKSHSNLPNSHLGFYGDSTLSNSEWRTSNLLHSRCRVKDAFAEVVSGAWLAASCQHRGLKNTQLFVSRQHSGLFCCRVILLHSRSVFACARNLFLLKHVLFVPHLLGTSYKPVL